jgi:hypothetical protein
MLWLAKMSSHARGLKNQQHPVSLAGEITIRQAQDFLLAAIMFTLRERWRQKTALVTYSIE